MSDPLTDAVTPLREAMDVLAAAGQSLRERHPLPSASSQGMAELEGEQRYAGIWGDEPVWTAFTLAGLSLFAAEDGIRAVSRLFATPHEPVTVFAHMIVGRGILEACARARWLVELRRGFDTHERVARVLANRAKDLTERRRVELAADPVKASHTFDELEQMLVAAEARGMAHRSRKKKVILNVEMPGYRQLVVDLFASSAVGDDGLPDVIYSYFSSISHAQTFGLLESVDRDHAEVDPFGAGVKVPLFTSSSGVNSCMAMVSLGYVEAVQAYCNLMGWDDATWQATRVATLAAVATALPVQVPDASQSEAVQ